jgi:hypothetical protein
MNTAKHVYFAILDNEVIGDTATSMLDLIEQIEILSLQECLKVNVVRLDLTTLEISVINKEFAKTWLIHDDDNGSIDEDYSIPCFIEYHYDDAQEYVCSVIDDILSVRLHIEVERFGHVQYGLTR